MMMQSQPTGEMPRKLTSISNMNPSENLFLKIIFKKIIKIFIYYFKITKFPYSNSNSKSLPSLKANINNYGKVKEKAG